MKVVIIVSRHTRCEYSVMGIQYFHVKNYIQVKYMKGFYGGSFP